MVSPTWCSGMAQARAPAMTTSTGLLSQARTVKFSAPASQEPSVRQIGLDVYGTALLQGGTAHSVSAGWAKLRTPSIHISRVHSVLPRHGRRGAGLWIQRLTFPYVWLYNH